MKIFHNEVCVFSGRLKKSKFPCWGKYVKKEYHEETGWICEICGHIGNAPGKCASSFILHAPEQDIETDASDASERCSTQKRLRRSLERKAKEGYWTIGPSVRSLEVHRGSSKKNYKVLA